MAEQSSDAGSTARTVYMLTTVDNPYNPFTEWDEWYSFDASKGYHTPGLLDRIVKTSEELSDADQALAIQEGIGEIARENVLGIYRLVSEDSFVPGNPNVLDENFG